ncbi:hypothetical protein ERO13_A11G196200v2 [Gossypium hirsutum]|nr:hypothetical protein ERO13_A11G196200v2 [Gossypium hirsutum]
MIVAESIPIEIPNIMACNPAYASAANEDETLLLRTVFNARISPIRPRTTRLEVDLEFFFCQKLHQTKSSPSYSLLVVCGFYPYINYKAQQKSQHYLQVPLLKT